MPVKRTPTEAEMQALVNEFRAQWHAGEVVGPWLRKHQHRLRQLVDEGWSWASVGEALTVAGVTYRTGRPWSPVVLRLDVKRNSRPLKRQQQADTAGQGQTDQQPLAPEPRASPQAAPKAQTQFRPARPAPAAPQVTAGLAQAAGPPAPKVPRFQFVKMKDQEPPRPLTPEELKEREAIRKRFS